MTKVFCITGATATGKSEVALEVAEQNNAEIISCDSIQVYKGLDIGTAKLKKSEMRGITHHLIDILPASSNYSVDSFIKDATNAVTEISKRNKNIVIVGGTGFYLSALLLGYSLAETKGSPEYRQELEELGQERGSPFLHQKLSEIDKLASDKISPNDTKRIIRALEIYKMSGNTKSATAKMGKSKKFDYSQIVLEMDRTLLYDRINLRVDKMLEKGLLEEVKGLRQYKDCLSMQAIGYKEIMQYLDGNFSIDEAVSKIKQNSRNFAKRQITFFKWMKTEKEFVDKNNLDYILKTARKFFNGHY